MKNVKKYVFEAYLCEDDVNYVKSFINNNTSGILNYINDENEINFEDKLVNNEEEDLIFFSSASDQHIPEYIRLKSHYNNSLYVDLHYCSSATVYNIKDKTQYTNFKKSLDVSKNYFYRLHRIENSELCKVECIDEEIKQVGEKLDIKGTIKNYIEKVRDNYINGKYDEDDEEKAVKFIENNANNMEHYEIIVDRLAIGRKAFKKDDSIKRISNVLLQKTTRSKLLNFLSISIAVDSSDHTVKFISDLFGIEDGLLQGESLDVVNSNKFYNSLKQTYYWERRWDKSSVYKYLEDYSIDSLLSDALALRIMRNGVMNSTQLLTLMTYALEYMTEYSMDTSNVIETFRNTLINFVVNTDNSHSMYSYASDIKFDTKNKSHMIIAEIYTEALENLSVRTATIYRKEVLNYLNRDVCVDSVKDFAKTIFAIATKKNYKKIKKLKMTLKLQ